MIWIAAGAATAAGVTIGWMVRGARNNTGETRTDWKTRLAARDHDLLEAREQLAAAVEETQQATARAHAAEAETAELRGEVDSLRGHAEERDRELERLEDLVIELRAHAAERGTETSDQVELEQARTTIADLERRLEAAESAPAPAPTSDAEAPTVAILQEQLDEARATIVELESRIAEDAAPRPASGDAGLLRQLEELESELASLQSQQCPDPGAHRSESRATFLQTAVPDPDWEWDDDEDAPLAPVLSLRPLDDAGADTPDPAPAEAVEQPAESSLDQADDHGDDATVLADAALIFPDDEWGAEDWTRDDDWEPLPGEAGEVAETVGDAGDGPAAPTVPDDLTEIKGIGPKISTMLERMGIVTFQDLARFDGYDREELSELFNGLAGRMERGNWIEAARKLHMAKYGEEA